MFKTCKILRRMLPVFLLVGCVMVVMSGCSDSDDGGKEISVILTKPVVTDAESSQFMDINCSGSWIISFEYPEGSSEWCSADPNEGVGNAKDVRLLFSVNRSKDERKARIVLKLKSGNAEFKTEIIQKGYSVKPPDPEPDPDPDPDPEPEPIEPDSKGWMELPKIDNQPGCKYIVHYTTLGGKTVRNYSMYYDTNEKLAYWVAYPHVRGYIGNIKRTNAWSYDPKLDISEQINLKKGISGYDRGHQIPSGDRTVDKATNRQTFYFTNMTPQLGNLNQRWWAGLESKIRDSWVSVKDTLYLVTGAILKTKSGTETVKYARDNNNVKMAIPNYYFKVLLQPYTGNGNVNGYRAIGFWVDHKALSGSDFLSKTKSVRDIEEMTGIDFFTNLFPNDPEKRDAIEKSYKPSVWGL